MPINDEKDCEINQLTMKVVELENELDRAIESNQKSMQEIASWETKFLNLEAKFSVLSKSHEMLLDSNKELADALSKSNFISPSVFRSFTYKDMNNLGTLYYCRDCMKIVSDESCPKALHDIRGMKLVDYLNWKIDKIGGYK